MDGKSSTNAATDLCLSCGICCRGLLHSWGKLRPEEVEAAQRNGMELADRDEPAFRLPCPRFEGCCTIYRERPHACQRFRCALLRRVEDGEIELGEGLAVVREARRLITEAEAVTGPNEFITRFRSHLRSPGNDHSAVEKVRLTALAIYLDRHFVLSRDGYFYSIRAVGAEENE